MYLKGNHGWLNHSQLKMKTSVCGLKQVMLRAWEGALLFDLFIQFSLCISETDPKYNRLWELSNKKEIEVNNQIFLLPSLMQCWFCSELNLTSSSTVLFSAWQDWALVSSQKSPATGLDGRKFPFRSRQLFRQTSLFPLLTAAIEDGVTVALFTAFDGGWSLELLHGAQKTHSMFKANNN